MIWIQIIDFEMLCELKPCFNDINATEVFVDDCLGNVKRSFCAPVVDAKSEKVLENKKQYAVNVEMFLEDT